MTVSITLQPEKKKLLKESIRRYFGEYLDQDVGDLKAEMLLDFCLKEICPTVYNQAVADVQARLHERVNDLEVECYKAEMTYWERKGR